MARKQTRIAAVQTLVLTQIDGARKRITTFERQLVKRGRAQEKRIGSLIKGVGVGKQVRLIGKRAVAARNALQRRVLRLQAQVIELLGVATRTEIQQLNRALGRVSKRVEALSKRPQAAA